MTDGDRVGRREHIRLRLTIHGVELTVSGASAYAFAHISLTADEADALAVALQEHAASLRATDGALKSHMTEWGLSR